MAAPTTNGRRPATGRRAGATPTGSTTAGRPPAPAARGAGQQQPVVPLPLVGVTVAAVGLVTVVCAVVSYSHIRDLAIIAGMGSLASWLPLGVDGLVVASSCSLIVDHHLKRPGQALAWVGVALGLAGSLAANVLAVDPDLVSLRAVRWVLAGYTPAALAVSGHLLFRMLGEQHRPAGPPVAAHGDTADSAGLRELEDLARLVGERDEEVRSHSWQPWGQTQTGASTSTSLRRVPILTPADLHALPRGRGVLCSPNAPPAELTLPAWWERPDAAQLKDQAAAA
jgi:hypothetical protein